MSTVVLIMGYPSSGKSRLAKTFIDKGYQNLNRDTIGGSIIDLLPKLESYLIDNKDVVLDNLFPNVEIRKPFIDLGKKYKANIEAHVMGTSMEDSQFNFLERMLKLEGRMLSFEEIKKSKNPSIFPPAVFYKYRKDYVKPSKEEGFDLIVNHSFTRKLHDGFNTKLLICDFDSTLRECIDGNGKYPVEPSQVKIMPNRARILKEYLDRGYKLCGVSNQSGIHKGELTHQKAVECFEETNRLLGVEIDYRFCPHQSAPLSCYCRKPNSLFGIEFIHKYKASAKDSYFVGDFHSDKTFAQRLNISYVDASLFFK
jgi:HAD superfamily hydrolase (TIGR01662 family)